MTRRQNPHGASPRPLADGPGGCRGLDRRRARGPAAGAATSGATPQQPTNIELRITGEPGTPPRLAVPDLIALSPDKEVQDAARVIGEVLWDDMDFEREFYMIPRDTYKSIPRRPCRSVRCRSIAGASSARMVS